jgi:cyclophilin family peptidyl-prolyl cis-trans isomerase
MLTMIMAMALGYQDKPEAVPGPPGVKIADERLMVNTPAGVIAIALYPEVAPQNVAHVIKLAQAGVYDGATIPRIEPNFVLQFSAPETERQPPLTPELRALIKPLPAEFSTTLKHRRGTVNMARLDGDINSATTSFCIFLGDAPHLDGKYTIIGHVEYGMDVVEELIKAPLEGARPVEALVIKQMFFVTGKELQDKPPPRARRIFYGTSTAVSPAGNYDPKQGVTIQDRNVVFSIGIILMMICVLIPMMMPSLKPKQSQTIQLISVLIGGFLLVAVLQPVSIALFQTKETYNTGHLIAIILFFGLLGIFRLMSSFESAA